MKNQVLFALASFITLIVLSVFSVEPAQAFSCKKTVGGTVVEQCCNQTGASCASVFGTGWTGTCGDTSVGGVCSEVGTLETMCGPNADQPCVAPSGQADAPYCAGTPSGDRLHVTDPLSKLIRVHGVKDSAGQPLETVMVTVWFNKAQMAQLRRFGDKIGEPAWGASNGDPLAGYTVYWSGKNDLENMGDGLGDIFELGYSTNALVVGKDNRGFNFGNVLQFLSLGDNPELMKIRIKIEARSFKATAGWYCADATTGSCVFKQDPNGALGFLLQSSCQTECQRPCAEGDGMNCVPRPADNEPYYAVLACSNSDQACKDARPDDWRKGSRSTWRTKNTFFDQVISFERTECLKNTSDSVGNSKFSMQCVAPSAPTIADTTFRFRLDNIVQPMAKIPGSMVFFRIGWGWETAGGKDVYGNSGHVWSEADKQTIRNFMGTPKYEGCYDGDVVKDQRWNYGNATVPPLNCLANQNYRFMYEIRTNNQYSLLSRTADLKGSANFTIPDRSISLAGLSDWLNSQGWIDRNITLNAAMEIPLSIPGQTDPYWATYENTGVQFTSFKAESLLTQCEGPSARCTNPVYLVGGHLFEREDGSYLPITLRWVHNAALDTATRSFAIHIEGLGDTEIPRKEGSSTAEEYEYVIEPSAVATLFDYMRSHSLDEIPFTITGKTGTANVCPAASLIGIPKKPTDRTYGCNSGNQCEPMQTGPYTASNCDNACPTEEPKFGCNENNQCVPDPNGSYTTDNCNAACSPPPPPQQTYGCSSGNECVPMDGGSFTSSDCNNTCICPEDDCIPGSELQVSFNYVQSASCSTATPPRNTTGRYAINRDATSVDPTLPIGTSVQLTAPVALSELNRASVLHTDTGYFCNACNTSGGFSGLCSADFVKATGSDENADIVAYANINVRDISSLLNSWWQVIGGRTYGGTVQSAVPDDAAKVLLPDYDGSAAYDQFLTRSPSWSISRLGGFLLANVVNFKSAAISDGVPSYWLSERPRSGGISDYGRGLGSSFVTGTLPQRAGSDGTTTMYEYFNFELDVPSLERSGNQSWAELPTVDSDKLKDDVLGKFAFIRVLGNLTISPNVPIKVTAGQKFIILVTGDVAINSCTPNATDCVVHDTNKPIQVANGGLLMIVSKGTITVGSEVGETMDISGSLSNPPVLADSSTQTATKVALEGVYMADGKIIIQGNGNAAQPDKRFVGAGTFVGKGGVDMLRRYSKTGMGPEEQINARYLYGYTPTEVFFYRPDFVLTLPRLLYTSIQQYQEVL